MARMAFLIIVSSRTRQQVRNAENINNADRSMPDRQVPKCNANGSLAWNIMEILESRPPTFKDGPNSV